MYNSALDRFRGLTENFAITNLPSPCLFDNFVNHCLNLQTCVVLSRNQHLCWFLVWLSFILKMSPNLFM